MWSHNKSVKLSSICTKLMILVLFIIAFSAPSIVRNYMFDTLSKPDIAMALLITVYACSLPALVALISLDRLLSNIKKEAVFISENIRYLRRISWCCFAVSIILAISGLYYLMFFVVAAVAALFGLILRVVKNVIEQAMQIKDENDYTI